jgi:hypothetical protein
MMESEPVLWTNPDYIEAVTVIGIRDHSIVKKWRTRESTVGAKPMSRKTFMATFSEQ